MFSLIKVFSFFYKEFIGYINSKSESGNALAHKQDITLPRTYEKLTSYGEPDRFSGFARSFGTDRQKQRQTNTHPVTLLKGF